MKLYCGLLLLFLNCARTTEDIYEYGLTDSTENFHKRFSYWPSVHNAANLMKIRKRETAVAQVSLSEGGVVDSKQPEPVPLQPSVPLQTESKNDESKLSKGDAKTSQSAELPKVNTTLANTNETATASPVPLQTKTNETNSNVTSTAQKTQNKLDLNNPGTVKRGAIVFGGFALLAIAYFIFYRKKNQNDTNNTHSTIDANQFRYGVLQSEDKRDNLELSRVPLTMESDDDDDDEDLEIFDLEQKRKSLSYVNLQTNDEDVVYGSTESNRENERDNLLLDIEDRASDILINWKNNGDKSIL